MAILAAHLGVVDENSINDMSYLFFEDVLTELGHKLNFDAVVNYAGNAFCEKSWDMITENNPFHIKGQQAEPHHKLAAFFSQSKITILGREENKE